MTSSPCLIRYTLREMRPVEMKPPAPNDPIIGRMTGSRILTFYARNLSHTLTKSMVLSRTLVKIISKYKEASLTLTDSPQMKISHLYKSSFQIRHFGTQGIFQK